MPYSAVNQPWPWPFRNRGTPVFDADGADDLGITELDQYGSLGVFA